ncbi:Uncharacterized protein OS=Pirellula staleyi (strain ATCC 27377 / DSM 6068 / ICPB 4128) GN=Psta_4679 PE=4 SV=1: SBP_bac_10 [Gemmataceae bacterium]|nr:Uncharacterized protein OS=Pirellula staleyi (strain ATCC 27377 / DSM 6068 / ICPB 4128) GN=Psta_4679 PE=4 SV=1: SBP_bac_10 [Gemmataceae bacterium]VTU02577.1 Uncharacterized protein OS=Pirellula staleyi (strain ATCC 27377 / DSM 6068 / ICPB 4128) GN=Psta_4679 PE=4 SV=1: SBP_bac_10 [Gemmataceae bacterium]
MSDGLSNTIAFAEKQAIFRATVTYNEFNIYGYGHTGFFGHIPVFAAESAGLVTGVTPAVPAAAVGAGSKFQVVPAIDGTENLANWYQAHAPRPGGILAAMADGSVRLVSAGVSGETWWAACTPRARDTLGGDW